MYILQNEIHTILEKDNAQLKVAVGTLKELFYRYDIMIT